MKPKQRLLALLCALSLALAGLSLSLTLPATAVSPTVYILAVNDRFADLPSLPEAVNGIIYIPYTTFDRDATGEDLGVYYGIQQDREKGTILSLYSLNNILTFSVNQGTCTDGDGNLMSFRAIMRGGVVYIPANAVCAFFGLQFFFHPTTDRGTLIRVYNSSSSLSNTVFLSAGTGGMLSRYNAILQSLEPAPTPTPTPTATPRPTATPTPPVSGGKENVRVYLAVNASEATQDLTQLFPAGFRVLFLFTPDSLEEQASLVRRAVAAGHSVGLIVNGTPEEALLQLEEGNQLLSHIARVNTRMVLAGPELVSPLAGEGWLCWQSNVGGTTAPALLANLAVRYREGKLTLPADPRLIEQVVSRISADGYSVRQPLETDL